MNCQVSNNKHKHALKRCGFHTNKWVCTIHSCTAWMQLSYISKIFLQSFKTVLIMQYLLRASNSATRSTFPRNETCKCVLSYFNANSCSLFQSLSFKHHSCQKIRPNWEMYFGHRDEIVNWHLIVESDSVAGWFRFFNWCESVSFYGNKIAQ